jgi:hypothetical protein
MFQLVLVTILMHLRQLCGSCGADKTCVFIRLVPEMSDEQKQRPFDTFSDLLGHLTNNILSNIITVDETLCKFAKETADIPATQESSHAEITDDENVHHSLRYQGSCSL